MGHVVTELTPGTLITPTLRLVRPLGAGGMGAVWVAEHLGLKSQVVVKFMAEDLAKNPEAVARFSREAAAASQVKSQHVVHMIDYGLATNGLPYIAMELLEGEDLAHVIARRGRLPGTEVVSIVTQVARALVRAHEKGIVHRDIKPDNIFLTDSGGDEPFVKVLDFGIAKSAIADAVATTQTGAMLGTPYYMSPEQVLGSKSIDHRADLWALGAVAFEALTGDLPFRGETVGAISVAICHGAFKLPSQLNPALSPAVDAWFERACAREVTARFTSARELSDALARAILGSAPEASRASAPQSAPTSPASTSAPNPMSSTEIELLAPTLPLPLGRVTTNGASSSSARARTPQRITTTLLGWARGRRWVMILALGALAGALIGVVAFAVSGSGRVREDPQTDLRKSDRRHSAGQEPAPAPIPTETNQPATSAVVKTSTATPIATPPKSGVAVKPTTGGSASASSATTAAPNASTTIAPKKKPANVILE